jgi:hypothetical protein
MNISPADYEKPGSFYLGREYDIASKQMGDQLVLYDSKDLVTHGVVLGMTGSGKTGLCLAILEEAALDKVPAIIIDPKGDITNFMLTFPNLSGDEFRPWINEEDAAKKGQSPDEYAAAQAELWKKGLAEWGQTGERIQKLRDAVDVNVFTPGSNAGVPVSILASLAAPPFEIVDDAELFSERIESTASSLLGLIGLDADPINSRDHILLSQVLERSWRAKTDLDLEKIIAAIQAPPFDKIGVVALEEFMPEKKRSELAMKLNNLLASPGFQTWLSGEALDIKKLLTAPDGRPRMSVLSIAHLNDAERMFFVSLVLNQMVGWMRTQSGTTSLRALLYMDEIYGYLPPTQNPPSKKPMMVLLKQSRAFGLGVLLATQNPVDLDYKALSNMGTWWLGRLQTERDKARVLDGLEGAAASQGAKFDRASLDKMLAALGNRIFLMNNVHDDAPTLMQVRWCLSYLRGPLTRTQIKTLMDPKRAAFAGAGPSAEKAVAGGAVGTRPDLPPSLAQYYLPITSPAASPLPVVYKPSLLVAADVLFTDKAKDISEKRSLAWLTPLGADEAALSSQASAVKLDVEKLSREPLPGTPSWAALPLFARKTSTYTDAKEAAVDRIYQEEGLDILYSAQTEEYGQPGENEAEFRARLAAKSSAAREAEMAKLESKYAVKRRNIEEDRARAKDAISREQSQRNTGCVSTLMGMLGPILKVATGKRSAAGLGGLATAGRSAARTMQQQGDIGRAEDRLKRVEEEAAALEAEIAKAQQEIRERYDTGAEKFRTETVKPLKKNIVITAAGLAWVPWYDVGGGKLESAFE